MKTIIIAHNYTENSFAAMSFYLAHHIANLGNRVVFISHKPFFSERKIIKKQNGEIIIYSWVTEKRPTSLKDFIWFAKIYLKYKPDAVIGHFVGSNIAIGVSKILSFSRIKSLIYYHTLTSQILADQSKITFKQKLLFFRKKIFYKLFCDLVICPSELAKKDFETFFRSNKGYVVLNPMVDRYKNNKVLSIENIVISYLGRLDPSKGVVDLIKAFLKYKSENPKSKLILNIAGGGSEASVIQEMIVNCSFIHYLGGLPYSKIDDYLRACHYIIIPSKFDALNMVGIESMMNSTPLLISNKTGLSEYLTEGKECLKFDPNIDSIVSLLEKVEGKIRNNHDLMSTQARKTYLDFFSIDNYCNSISKIIL
jgi:glycosyltransferase involved in cell wall biosynthesis